METKSILPATWDLPDVFRRRMGTTAGRQRAMFHEGHLLLVLHAAPSADDDERHGCFFWRLPDGEWRASEQGSGVAALATHLNDYVAAIEGCDDSVEAATSAEDYFAAIENLSPLLRAATHQHQVLQEARKLVNDDRAILDLRDRGYQIERMATLLYDGAKTGLDFAMARRAEEQAVASHRMSVAAHRLNIMASFFFPIATLSALFGVNVLHGWEKTPGPGPFLVLLVVGLASGGLLTAYVNRAGKESRSEA